MAYLDAAKKAAIKKKWHGALPSSSIQMLMDEVAAAIAADAGDGVSDLPAAEGVAEASKLVQLGANKEVDEVHAEELYIGAGAGSIVSATAAELNKLADLTTSAAELERLAGLTVNAAQLNAAPVNPGTAAQAILRVAAAVEDGETVTIGSDVYEIDTDALVAEGNILVDCTGGSEVASQGTLTIAVLPTAGDTFTIGSKEYTFVPTGTGNAEGEVDIGANLEAAQDNAVAAINGSDGYNTANAVASAAAFSVGNESVITADTPGTAGDSIATTETFADVGNVFDDTSLGATVAGVDPTAGEGSDALIAAINASGTEAVSAIDIGANEVLVRADAVGDVAIATTETLDGANNAWDAVETYGGSAGSQMKQANISRVPSAQDVALGNMHFALDFTPSFVFVQIRVTADGTLKAWDGGVIIGSNRVQITNGGAVDWDTSDTAYVVAYE